MGARQAVEIVNRREIAAGADAGRAGRRLRGRAPAGAGPAAAGFVDEVIAPTETRERIALVWSGREVTPGGEPLARRESRNATEEAILDAAREALAEKGSAG